MSIINSIKTLYETNPSLAAIFGLSSAGIISFLIYIFKSSILKFIKFLFSRITIQIEIDNRFGIFNKVSNYIYINNLKFIRKAIFNQSFLKGFEKENVVHSMNIGMGFHIVFFKFRPLLIEVKELDSQNSDERKITMCLTFFCLSYKYVYKFFNSIYVDYRNKEENSPDIEFFLRNSYGNYYGVLNKRGFDEVYLSKEIKKSLLDKVSYFINNKDIYKRKNIPYHLGILLYGPPGTGKTSIIKAIASHFKLKLTIYSDIVNFIKDMNTCSLQNFYDLDEKTNLVVLEDIDLLVSNSRDLDELEIVRTISSKEKETSKLKSSEEFEYNSKRILHDLLNSLDGLTTEENFIILATTNDIKNIDPALIRPGRFDHIIEIGYINDEVFSEVVKKYYDKELKKFSLINNKITVSQLQVDYLTGMTFEDFMKKYTVFYEKI